MVDRPMYASPEPAPPVRVHDPLAVALGNASLLGVGYLILGRRKTAVGTGIVTLVLASVLVSAARWWCEALVLVWWAAVIAHGWSAAGGRGAGATVPRQRMVAAGVTVPVLLAVGLLRFDASRIEQRVAEAREGGDCARVLNDGASVWFGHRVAGAPVALRSDEAVEACRRLRTAEAKLAAGLAGGDTGSVKAGFDILASVLAEPGHGRTAGTVLDGFLGRLPTNDACRTVAVTDWLHNRRPSHDALDRSAGAVTRAAPAALVGCGDDLMKAKEWTNARARYQQLLDQYPQDGHAGAARNGVRQATLSIELAHVRSLLEGSSTDEQPAYCSSPAKYSGARPYGRGINRALFYGNDGYTDDLPGKWRVRDPASAVLVVCVGERKKGSVVESCTYRSRSSGKLYQVRFHKVALPVKVYELRTGRLVADRRVQIGGRSCPSVIKYSSGFLDDFGPDPDRYVNPSKGDVRAAFEPLIDR
ncbi:tol-pal system YbgF family protein [Actinomadura sp. 3N508]|uniref:tol-pal system YbgF family protein n=1 Tax=Actinomadura sp. 3N508 TaxID=3375153 RepID=UPI0037979704